MGIIYKISEKDSFIDSLALGLLNDSTYRQNLGDSLIVLPNQMSCKLLYEAIVKYSDDKIRVPDIIPLSDLSNPNDPFKFLPEFLSMPGCIEMEEIKLFLWTVLCDWEKEHKNDYQIDKTEFSNEFLKFFLELEEIECDIGQLLKKITLTNYTEYNQLLVKFLKFFINKWDLYKIRMNKVSFIQYRNQIVNLRRKTLSKITKYNKIILAGTTGVNLCTRRFIKELTNIDKGVFIFHDIVKIKTKIENSSNPNYLGDKLKLFVKEEIKIWGRKPANLPEKKITQTYVETDNIYQEANLICEIISNNNNLGIHSNVITNNLYLRNLILIKMADYYKLRDEQDYSSVTNLLYVSILKLLDYYSNIEEKPNKSRNVNQFKENKSSKDVVTKFLSEKYDLDDIEIESWLDYYGQDEKRLFNKLFSFLANVAIAGAEIDNEIKINIKNALERIRLLARNNLKELENILNFLVISNSNIFYQNSELTIISSKEARLKTYDNAIIADVSDTSWKASNSGIFTLSDFSKILGVNLQNLRDGQMANDFLRHRYANNLILTKSRFSRKKNNISYYWFKEFSSKEIKKIYYKKLDSAVDVGKPIAKVSVMPEQKYRIHDFSVTQIEKLIHNPYSIYALKILKLKPMAIFEFEQERQFFGTIIHHIIDQYVSYYKFFNDDEGGVSDIMKLEEKEKYLLSLFDKEMKKTSFRNSIIRAWRNRFEYIAPWIINQHDQSIKDSLELYSEYSSSVVVKNINLKAKIDRIERYSNKFKIIDYKTGIPPSLLNVKKGLSPQLILEAYICAKVFGIEIENILLEYWELKGKKLKDGIIHEINNIADIVADIECNLENIISDYQASDTPIFAFPNENHIPQYDDYFHLSRTHR